MDDNAGSPIRHSTSPPTRSQNNSAADNVDYYYERKNYLAANNVLDVINSKIAQLDEAFNNYSILDMDSAQPESRQSDYFGVSRPLSSAKLKLKSLAKEREAREIKQFAGIYTMKSLFYDKKLAPLASLSNVKEDPAAVIAKKPKLIELYQYPGFENVAILELPHDLKIEDILAKVLDSIVLLRKQPKYKDFLKRIYLKSESKEIIVDTFWWCFMDKFQKNSANTQQKLFERVAKNYVKLLLKIDIDPIYKDTFFKQYSNLLAMSVYTIFCTSFPESYTHFDPNFRNYLCNLAHVWISGCRPLPNSHLQWNYKLLDPPQAIFANEVLTNKNNMANIISFDDDQQQQQQQHHTHQSSMQSHGVSLVASSSAPATTTLVNDGDMSPQHRRPTESEKIKKKKVLSHAVGKGPRLQNCLFDLNGHSPLVHFFLYESGFNKASTYETTITHPQIASLPPLDATTYHDIIVNSLKISRKIQNECKMAFVKQKSELSQLKIREYKSLRKFHDQEKKLMKRNKEVKYLGDLIAMESKRDQKSTSFAPDLALFKSLSNL